MAVFFVITHSLTIKHFLLHPWQAHQLVEALGWHHSDLLQGLKVFGTHVAVVLPVSPLFTPFQFICSTFLVPTLLCPIAL